MILRMYPRLGWNRLRYGRALDILITHSPVRDLGDREDRPHRGFKALRHLLKRWHPRYMLHGHVHLYDRSEPWMIDFECTTIINVYPYRVLDLDLSTRIDDRFPVDANPCYPPMGDPARPRGAAVTEERAHE
jgi:hypothetical protein